MDPVRNKEIAAKAFLGDLWQSGYRCIELRRDGRAIIFFCTLCSVPCYNDSSVSDHLRGNQHKKKLGNASISPAVQNEFQEIVFDDLKQLPDVLKGKTKTNSAINDPEILIPPSSLEWIGSGQMYVSEDKSIPSGQVWCQWLGGNVTSNIPGEVKVADNSAYGVVIFPYSDAIGRKGGWKPTHLVKKGNEEKLQIVDLLRQHISNSEESSPFLLDLLSREGLVSGDDRSGKDLSGKVLRKVLHKKGLNFMQRSCFICHQQMLPEKAVSTLLNLKTGRLMCSSRNERGAFHVYHPSCLVDWIILSESKFRSSSAAKTSGPRMRGQINKKPRKGKANTLSLCTGPLFCPECQGTGTEVQGHKLEQPRYRLAQVFEWILELIQARRAWTCHPEKQHINSRGLILPDLNMKSTITHIGSVQLYAAGNMQFLAGALSMTLLANRQNLTKEKKDSVQNGFM